MPRLRLIIGPPRSGKSSLVLREAAARARTLADPDVPPGLLLVPEQQAAQTQRALLEAVGDSAVSAGVVVCGLSRLARQLEAVAGHAPREVSELGRRLLVWRLLAECDDAQLLGAADPLRRRETAAQLASLLGELQTCGQLPIEDLRMPIDDLTSSRRMAALVDLATRYQRECAARGLSFTRPAARIPALLAQGCWPHLEQTDVWLDGFRSFTPSEELALAVLLERSRSVTATLLLDPARLEGPLDGDLYDTYASTRMQFRRWEALAARIGAEVEVEEIKAGTSGVGLRARQSFPAEEAGTEGRPTETRWVVCADERGEVEAAVAEVRRLVLPPELGGRGLRYGQISIVARELSPYADLLAARLRAAGVPHFIDQPRALAHHPAVELLRCGLRLALGLASSDDVYTLLKTGLMSSRLSSATAVSRCGWQSQPGRAVVESIVDSRKSEGESRESEVRSRSEARETVIMARPGELSSPQGQADEPLGEADDPMARPGELSSPQGPADERLREAEAHLENFARQHGLTPQDWLDSAPWQPLRSRRNVDNASVVAHTSALDALRRELLAPVLRLREELGAPLTVREVLAAAWRHLLDAPVQAELARWAAEADAAGDGDAAAIHRGVLHPLAELVDELVLLAGELLVESRESEVGSRSEAELWRRLPAAESQAGAPAPPEDAGRDARATEPPQWAAPTLANAITPSELLEWLERGLGELHLSFPPPRLDCVLATDIERGRHPDVAATLVLGLAEDRWPKRPPQHGYFSAEQRAQLAAAGVLTSGDDSAAEPYFALVAFTRPSELLYLSRPAADAEGRAREPSPYWDVGSVVGDSQAETPAPLYENMQVGGPALPGAPPVTAAEVLVRAALDPRDGALQEAALRLAQRAPQTARAIAWARRCAGQRSRELPAELLREALQRHSDDGHVSDHGDLVLSVAQLEDYAACPQRHFARHLLGVVGRDEARAGVSLGAFYHRLMQLAVRRLQRNGFPQRGNAPEDVRDAVAWALGELGPELERQRCAGSLHVLERAAVLAGQATAQLLELARQGRVPEQLGARYGPGEKLPPLSVHTATGTVQLRGRIDRLDVASDGAATVVDYSVGGGNIDPARLLYGQQLRLTAALLATRAGRARGGAELRAGGAEIQSLEPRRSNKPEKWYEPARLVPDYARESDRQKNAGLLEGALASTEHALAQQVEALLSGRIAALPLRQGRGYSACSGCEYRALCRFDPLAGERWREIELSAAEAKNIVLQGGALGDEPGDTSESAAANMSDAAEPDGTRNSADIADTNPETRI